MEIDVRPCSSPEELRDSLNAISHYFGQENTSEDAERFARWIELERMHAAFDGAGRVQDSLGVPDIEVGVERFENLPLLR